MPVDGAGGFQSVMDAPPPFSYESPQPPITDEDVFHVIFIKKSTEVIESVQPSQAIVKMVVSHKNIIIRNSEGSQIIFPMAMIYSVVSKNNNLTLTIDDNPMDRTNASGEVLKNIILARTSPKKSRIWKY